jgi:hypothetical protein
VINLKIAGIITRLAGWMLFFSLPVVFMLSQQGNGSVTDVIGLGVYWLFCGTYLFLFYLSSLVLIPKLYLKRRYVPFFGIILLLFAGVYAIKPFDQLMSRHQRNQSNIAYDPPRDARPMPPPGFGGPPP